MTTTSNKPSPKPQHPVDSTNVDGEARKQRSDGAEARTRLLQMALRLFADKGFSKTSTREIAQAAGVNIASIKYYFGDKAGLYRAVFTEPMGTSCDYIPVNSDTFTLHESLAEFFKNFLEPLKQSDLVQLCVRLHFREMLEPTGLWEEEIGSNIKPSHDALVAILMRHLDVAEEDDEIHRLVFSIVGMAVHLMIAHDVIDTIRPSLIKAPAAIDQWAEQLTAYAEAMVAVEATRRRSLIQ
ncbi:CerR family C-terminal domain-containing protein [Herminiimonas arsenitoxidans]|uniref:CerR family C-terminal domain-containing protein n=1 Tax=Herminiimonas arsenitoxidans TaxID=1809410 RepID=UPI0012FF893A|nr:CerR family C-terminal domain-containing protein [Herminiimonas arsenitoxidans]